MESISEAADAPSRGISAVNPREAGGGIHVDALPAGRHCCGIQASARSTAASL
jgi:hypothetical protein